MPRDGKRNECQTRLYNEEANVLQLHQKVFSLPSRGDGIIYNFIIISEKLSDFQTIPRREILLAERFINSSIFQPTKFLMPDPHLRTDQFNNLFLITTNFAVAPRSFVLLTLTACTCAQCTVLVSITVIMVSLSSRHL